MKISKLLELTPFEEKYLNELFDLSTEIKIFSLMNLSPLGDPLFFKARFFAQKIADFLLDEKGEIREKNLENLKLEFDKGLFLFGIQCEEDFLVFEHLKTCVENLLKNISLRKWIKKFSLPLAGKLAEDLIRDTLYPELITTLKTFHVRKAVLTSYLTRLRQITGSCFATAPAIFIQKKEPENLFKDLYDLLTLGELRRVVEGKEMAAPLSPFLGEGELDRPFKEDEHLPFSPRLIFSLDAAGFFSSADSFQKKVQKLSETLRVVGKSNSCRELLDSIFLKELNLTKEEVVKQLSLNKQKIDPRIGQGLFYIKTSSQEKLVADYLKKVETAKKGFWNFSECSLLRAWEFTLASFCDAKMDFTRWNLYIALGLHPDEKNGIAAFFYQYLQQKLQELNKEALRYQAEYEDALSSIKTAEALIANAYSKEEHHHLRARLNNAVHTANICLEMRENASKKAEALVQFYPDLLLHLDQKLQDNFQEIFDPSVLQVQENLYEDSQAGFRLVYKHGRSRASLWTPIHTEEEFISSLRDFFSFTEPFLEIPKAFDRAFISELFTHLIVYIQSAEFIKKVNERTQRAGRKSPWDYSSGGTLEMLLQNYYANQRAFSEIKWDPDTPFDLMQSILDFTQNKETPLLFHSPNHAFLLEPTLICEDPWKKIEACKKFIKNLSFTEDVQSYLFEQIGNKIPQEKQALFFHLARQKQGKGSVQEFRRDLVSILKGLGDSFSYKIIDSFLYQSLPVFSKEEGKAIFQKIFEKLGVKEDLDLFFKALSQEYFFSSEIRNLIKTFLLRDKEFSFSRRDIDLEIEEQLISLGCRYPYPILFADTNWSDWFFGWILNYETEEIELWRLNRMGSKGVPMEYENLWFSKEAKTEWVLYFEI